MIAAKALGKGELICHKTGLFLLLTAGFAVLSLLFHLTGPQAAVAILAFLTFGAVGFLDYPKFLLLAVFLRSALDAFFDTTLPLGPLNLNPAGVVGLSLIFFTFFHLYPNRKLFNFPICKGLLVFLFLLIPSVLSAFIHFGSGGAVAIKEFIRLASLLALLASLLVFFKTPADMRKLFWAAAASLAVPLTVGFYQAATGTGNTFSTAGQNRIFGTLFHPNTLALYLLVFIAIALAWHKNQPSLSKKFLLGTLLTAQFLTYSMTGLVATALVFAIYIYQSKNRRILWAGLLIFLLPLFSQNWQARFQQINQMNLTEEIRSGEISNSFSWRVLHWYVLLNYAKEHPVTGWGLLTTEKITPWKTEEGQGYAAHNDLVRIFLESGLLGLCGYFAFLLFTGRWIFKVKSPEGQTGDLRPALKAIFISFLILSAGASEPLIHTAFVYYFFAFVALEKNGFFFQHLKLSPAVADKDKRVYGSV